MDEYNKQVNEAQGRLSTIMTAINRENLTLEEKTQQKRDIEVSIAELEAEAKIAKEKTDFFVTEKTHAKNELIEVKNELGKEKGALADVMRKRSEVEKDLQDFEENAAGEKARLKADNTAQRNEMDNKKDEFAKEMKVLADNKNLLIEELSSKAMMLENMNKKEVEKQEKINELNHKIASLVAEAEKVEEKIKYLKNDLIDQVSEIEKCEMTIESLNVEIAGKQAEKESIQKDVAKAEEKHAEYVQAKMVLQKDKEELANRELFIMSKYEQAGVAYSGEMLDTTKTALADKADLQQMKEDLDKREVFIKRKFEEAGIAYM